MTSRAPSDDKLDDVLAEIEAARSDPSWLSEDVPPRRLIRAPETLAQGRWVPSRSAVVAIVACVVLAALIFAARVLLSSRGQDVSTPRASAQVAVSGQPTASPRGSATTGAVATSSPATHWSIHVVGAVKRPGVVTVAAESRVSDAVRAAGGLASDADVDGVNLARKLSDGEQVHIPRPGEKWTPPADAGGVGSGPAGSSPSGTNSGSGDENGLVNLNSASVEQLDSLPGVGPVMAERILDWRKEHGKFSSVDELGEVSGIGEKTLAKLKPKVTV